MTRIADILTRSRETILVDALGVLALAGFTSGPSAPARSDLSFAFLPAVRQGPRRGICPQLARPGLLPAPPGCLPGVVPADGHADCRRLLPRSAAVFLSLTGTRQDFGIVLGAPVARGASRGCVRRRRRRSASCIASGGGLQRQEDRGVAVAILARGASSPRRSPSKGGAGRRAPLLSIARSPSRASRPWRGCDRGSWPPSGPPRPDPVRGLHILSEAGIAPSEV